MPALEQILGLRTVNCLTPMPHPARSRLRRDGERRAEPPRREGRRLPPLSEMGDLQRREFHEALLDAASFEDLPGKWQAAILEAEQNRPKLRVVGD
jgi:hypothetical protein